MSKSIAFAVRVQALLDDGNAQIAEREVRACIAAGDDSPTLRVFLAVSLAGQFRYREAVKEFEAVPDLAASGVTFVVNHAIALIDGAADGAFEDGSAKAQRGVDMLRPHALSDDADPRVIYNFANGLAYIGQGDESRTQLHRCISVGFRTPKLFVNLANDYRTANRFSEAIDLCLEAIELLPDHDMAWASLARAFDSSFYLTGMRHSHLLMLAEVCCTRCESAPQRDPRSDQTVLMVREYHRRLGFPPPTKANLDHWRGWFVQADSNGDRELPFVASAARSRVLLNLLRECPHPGSWLPEPPVIRGFTHLSATEPRVSEWFRILNAVHSDYHAARLDYLSASGFIPDVPAYSGLVSYVDCSDDADDSARSRLLLDAIARSVNALDKLALFLKAYFGLAVSDREVYFAGRRSILNTLADWTDVGVKENLEALRAISADKSNPFISRANDVRDAVTHRYALVQRRTSTVLPEHGVAVSSNELQELAQRMLSVTKAAIYHAAGIVAWEDRRLEKQAGRVLAKTFDLRAED